MNTSELIDQLSQELKPVERTKKPSRNLLYWALPSLLVAWLLTHYTGPMRVSSTAQLLESPQFLLEVIVGVLLGSAAAYSALTLSIPGASLSTLSKIVTLALFALWLGLFAYGTFNPALPLDMSDKRPHCLLETLAFSLVPFAFLLMLVRQGAPLTRRTNGLLIGVAAAAFPALVMNLACMYDPLHILKLHVSSLACFGAIGFLIGHLILPSRQ